jgi:hypothetical protein
MSASGKLQRSVELRCQGRQPSYFLTLWEADAGTDGVRETTFEGQFEPLSERKQYEG